MKYSNKLYAKIIFILLYCAIFNINSVYAENTSALMPNKDKENALWNNFTFITDKYNAMKASAPQGKLERKDKTALLVMGFDHYTKNASKFGIGFYLAVVEKSFKNLYKNSSGEWKENDKYVDRSRLNGFELSYDKYFNNITVKSNLAIFFATEEDRNGKLTSSINPTILNLEVEYKDISYIFYPIFSTGILMKLTGIPFISNDPKSVSSSLTSLIGVGSAFAITNDVHLQPEVCIGGIFTNSLTDYDSDAFATIRLTANVNNLEFKVGYTYTYKDNKIKNDMHSLTARVTMFL